MCMRTTCNQCGKATWAGCGNHIEQALAGVPASQRCSCEPNDAPAKPSFLSRIFG